jgi:ACDE family multidrug resistance protein
MEERGIVTSLYGSVRFLGVAVGPPVFTWLMEQSPVLMFLSIASLALSSALLSIFFIKIKKESKPKPPAPGTQEFEFIRKLAGRRKSRA